MPWPSGSAFGDIAPSLSSDASRRAGFFLYLVNAHSFPAEGSWSVRAHDRPSGPTAAKAIGMTTLWVDNGSEQGEAAAEPHAIDHRTDDLGAWLDAIMGTDA